MKKIKIRIFAVHAKIWERAQYGASLPFAVLRSRKTGVRTEEGNPICGTDGGRARAHTTAICVSQDSAAQSASAGVKVNLCQGGVCILAVVRCAADDALLAVLAASPPPRHRIGPGLAGQNPPTAATRATRAGGERGGGDWRGGGEGGAAAEPGQRPHALSHPPSTAQETGGDTGE